MIALAWRNLWRNKRRTIITIASVLFAVLFSVLLRGFHKGTWNELIRSVLHSYSGYVQIHANGFWDNRSLDYTINQNDSILKSIDFEKLKIKNLIPRFESFALASNKEKIKGTIIVGIDPELEQSFTHINDKIVDGKYFSNNENGILVSQRLAEFLQISTNDSLVLISQGYQGASAAGLYHVIGIVKLPSPEFDNQMIFMPLKTAQDFYSAPSRLTSWIVDLSQESEMKKVVKNLQKILPTEKYEVMSWHEMLVELYQQFVSDEGGAKIMLAILYLIVGFGVFGTVMMMLSERRYEMGIMIAVGMKRYRLISLIATELIFICIIGLLSGIIVSIPILYYYHLNPITFSGEMAEVYKAFGMEPIMPVEWSTGYIINQAITIGIIAIVVLLYPIFYLYKFDIIKALKR